MSAGDKSLSPSPPAAIVFNASLRNRLPILDEDADDQSFFDALHYHVYHVVTPAIFIVGVVANAVSLVLGNRIRRGMSAIEQSAAVGLIALAASDLLFCASGVPELFVIKDGSDFIEDDVDIIANGSSSSYNEFDDVSDELSFSQSFFTFRRHFSFYYGLYRSPLHNVFLMSSTWIMVVVSAERCFAIHHPIRARLFAIRVWRAVAIYVAVFVLSAAVCAPLFFRYRVIEEPCKSDRSRTCHYYPVPNHLFRSGSTFRRVYIATWMTVGNLLPVGCLIITGTVLIKALYSSRRAVTDSVPCSRSTMQVEFGGSATYGANVRRNGNSCRSVKFPSATITVVLTTLTFCVLVCPSVIVDAVGQVVVAEQMTPRQYRIYRVAIVVCNLVLAIKVAGNFIFYIRLSRRTSRRRRQCLYGDGEQRVRFLPLGQWNSSDACLQRSHLMNSPLNGCQRSGSGGGGGTGGGATSAIVVNSSSNTTTSHGSMRTSASALRPYNNKSKTGISNSV